jgi:hypothetical protein
MMERGKRMFVPAFLLSRFLFFTGDVYAQEATFFREATGTVEMTLPALKAILDPQFRFITGFKADSSLAAPRLGTGKMFDAGIPGGLPPVTRARGHEGGGK